MLIESATTEFPDARHLAQDELIAVSAQTKRVQAAAGCADYRARKRAEKKSSAGLAAKKAGTGDPCTSIEQRLVVAAGPLAGPAVPPVAARVTTGRRRISARSAP